MPLISKENRTVLIEQVDVTKHIEVIDVSHAVGDEYPVIRFLVKDGIGKLLLKKYYIIEVHNTTDRVYTFYTVSGLVFETIRYDGGVYGLGAKAFVIKESVARFYGNE